jgi:pterin-4a-carbinolamine dehydratase
MTNPIDPIERAAPIIAQDRWRQVERGNDVSALTKAYEFLSPDDRSRFVADLMYYELQSQHHAKIVIEKDSVTVEVCTPGIDVVTELDRSYAAACDNSYRNIVYSY